MKRVSLYITIVFLTILALLSNSWELKGQASFSAVDQQLIGFAQRKKLVEGDFLQSSELLGKLDEVLKGSVNSLGKPENKSLGVFQHHYFSIGDTINTDRPYFIETGAHFNVTIAGIPISNVFKIRNIDGKFVLDRSSFSIAFEPEKFQAGLDRRLWQNRTPWDFLLEDESLILAKKEQELIESEYLYTFFQQLITSTDYQEYKQDLQDSVSIVKDSHLSSTLDTLNMIEQRYKKHKRKLFGTNYKDRLELEDKMDSISRQMEQLHPGGLITDKSKYYNIKKWEKYARSIQKLNIGYQLLEREDFVSAGLPVNGAGIKIGNEHLSGEVFYGRQAFSGYLLPSNGLQYFDNQLGNNILSANVSYHTAKGQNTKLVFLRVKTRQSLSEHNPAIASKVNYVIGLKTELPLTERLGVQASLYNSRFHFANQNTINRGLGIKDENLASQLNLSFTPISGVRLSGGYFRTGQAYISLADPFQLNNRQGVNFEIQLNAFKGKLSADYSFKAGVPTDETEAAGSFVQLRSLGRVSYYFAKSSLISLSFMPNVYRLQQEGESISNRQNIFNANAVFNKKLKQLHISTQLRATNFLQGQYLQDTALYFSQLLLEAGQVLSIGDRIAFEGRYLQSIRNDISRGSVGMSLGLSAKLRFRIEIFTSHNKVLQRNERGIYTQLQYKLGEKISLNTGISRVKRRQAPVSENQMITYGNASIFWTIFN